MRTQTVDRHGRRHPRRPLSVRFWERVATSDTCWEWTGTMTPNGYGTIQSGGREGRHQQAHRVSWELHIGPIPPDRFVLHKCDNRRCVRLSHLFLGTHADNMADMARKGRARGATKLTDDQVRMVRGHDGTNHAVASIFGVDAAVVSRIRNGKAYRWVES